MKKFFNKLCTLVIAVSVISCEYFDEPTDTLNVQSQEVPSIKFPSISLNGASPLIIVAGDAFTDPGAVATLGADDISSDMEVTSDVDASTVGVYSIDYTVSNVNALGQESTVTNTRFVAVQDPAGPGPSLAGNYSSTSTSFGGASFGQLMTVTDNGNGYYSATDIYAHPAADQPGNFFDLGNGNVVLEPVGTGASIFGLLITANLTTDPGNSIAFNITFPTINFSTTKPWDRQ